MIAIIYSSILFLALSTLMSTVPSPAQDLDQNSKTTIIGKVLSAKTNEPLAGSNIILAGTHYGTTARRDGSFILADIPPGTYEVRVSILGYRPESRTINLIQGERVILEFHLTANPIEFPNVEVIGSAPEAFLKIPGSGTLLSSDLILKTHPMSANELLRKVPGVCVRDEEGFGLRPNIGIRGLFPTRSTKVLLLEDGVPFAIAPYGDPASYYHPPIHRFNRVEVLKGSGQIRFGPQTIGGVINYLTPLPPMIPTGSVNVAMGNRDYLFGQVNYGGRWGNVGFLGDYSRKQGKLARENSSSTIQDLNAKVILNVNAHSSISLKLNLYDEKSNVTYAGLTQIEFEENPFQNQFKDDWFYFRRFGTHLIHDYDLGAGKILLTTNLYGYFIDRDWWRQGNNDGTNATPPPNIPGTRTILNPRRNDGRLREYTVWGIEPRVRLSYTLFGIQNETDIGARAHFELQDRKQVEGNSPTARTGIFREDNVRKAQAYSGFIQNRFLLSTRTVVSAGLRLEDVHYQRTNNLNGASGKAHISSWVPGVGFTYNPTAAVTFFGGLHRGFAPPRVEDVISNIDGTSIELDAEKSWNYELGARARVSELLQLDLTFFRLDFENQIIPASLAGGIVATLTNAGQTLHQGVEFKGAVNLDLSRTESSEVQGDAKHALMVDLAYTYLPVAEFRGQRFSVINRTIKVTGNRLTYAPEHMMVAGVGYVHPVGFDLRLEWVYVSRQFSDDLNTIPPSPNGRQGVIPAYSIWNLSANYPIQFLRLSTFVTIKNLLNKIYIVDRSRGILPGNPRLVQAGLRWEF